MKEENVEVLVSKEEVNMKWAEYFDIMLNVGKLKGGK